jgi:uroporphyrinogen-III synthase
MAPPATHTPPLNLYTPQTVTPPAQLDAALEQLGGFEFLAFTSKNGIYAVMSRLERLKGGERPARPLACCCVL